MDHGYGLKRLVGCLKKIGRIGPIRPIRPIDVHDWDYSSFFFFFFLPSGFFSSGFGS